MDEFDWLEIIKKVLILIAKVSFSIGLFIVFLTLIGTSGNDWEYVKIILLLALIIGIIFPSITGICYFILIVISKTLYSGRKVKDFDKAYIRDFPKHCSPALSSLIYDLKIDVYKDYTATILYLCVEKYLNLVNDGETYKLELVKQQDYSNLGRCEKYVLNIIENQIKFDENQFKKEILHEAKEKGLITDKKHSKISKILLLLFISIISLIISYNLSKIIFGFLVFIFALISFVLCFMISLKLKTDITFDFIDTEYIRTKKRKKYCSLLTRLKKIY